MKLTILALTTIAILSTACDKVGSTKLDTDEAKTSYAVGLQVGETVARQDLPNIEGAFLQGYRDGVAKAQPKLPAGEIQAALRRAQDAALKKQTVAMGDLEKVKADGLAYLKTNGAKQVVKTMASGLQYEVIDDGKGVSPKDGDTVEVHYTGTLIDGKKFDSSRDRGQPASFGINQVIPGWTEALKQMKVGSKWKLTIPSKLGYGEAGAPPHIPPNSVLLFEVELLSITKTPKAN